MNVNSLDSPSLSVVASSKVRRVGLREAKRVLERRVSGFEDDGGRLVLCRRLAITHSCSYDETYGAQQRGCSRRHHPGIRRPYPSLGLDRTLVDIVSVWACGEKEGWHTGREARDDLSVDGDGLVILAGLIVVLVYDLLVLTIVEDCR